VFEGFFDPDGEQFAFADPPRHKELRRVITPAFAMKAITAMTPAIEQHCIELVDSIPAGETLDFVEHVRTLPIMVICRLLGVSIDNLDRVVAWGDALESMNVVETREQIEAAKASFVTMNDFFREQFALKRDHPGEDLVSTLLEAELDGAKVSEATLLTYCSTVLAAGSDTTRAFHSSLAVAFADHPDQWSRLRNDRTLIPTAIEEALRYTNPARGFLRTALSDTQIDGVEIREGQKVYLIFDAADNDPTVFPEPRTFDIGRKPTVPNFAFGFGPHICIAAELVRMQTRFILDRLLDRFAEIQRAGEATPIHHVLRKGYATAPLRFDV
jgi:cytochrome P450